MRFEPKTAQEIDEAGLLPAGVYDFEVMEAEDTQSKAGNDMAAIAIRIEDSTGRAFKILDWLVATDGGAYKVRHFAESVGLIAEYEKGDMPAGLMMHKTGKCKLAVKPAEGQYRAKNTVADYVIDGTDAAFKKTVNQEVGALKRELLDDEIPF